MFKKFGQGETGDNKQHKTFNEASTSKHDHVSNPPENLGNPPSSKLQKFRDAGGIKSDPSQSLKTKIKVDRDFLRNNLDKLVKDLQNLNDLQRMGIDHYLYNRREKVIDFLQRLLQSASDPITGFGSNLGLGSDKPYVIDYRDAIHRLRSAGSEVLDKMPIDNKEEKTIIKQLSDCRNILQESFEHFDNDVKSIIEDKNQDTMDCEPSDNSSKTYNYIDKDFRIKNQDTMDWEISDNPEGSILSLANIDKRFQKALNIAVEANQYLLEYLSNEKFKTQCEKFISDQKIYSDQTRLCINKEEYNNSPIETGIFQTDEALRKFEAVVSDSAQLAATLRDLNEKYSEKITMYQSEFKRINKCMEEHFVYYHKQFDILKNAAESGNVERYKETAITKAAPSIKRIIDLIEKYDEFFLEYEHFIKSNHKFQKLEYKDNYENKIEDHKDNIDLLKECIFEIDRYFNINLVGNERQESVLSRNARTFDPCALSNVTDEPGLSEHFYDNKMEELLEESLRINGLMEYEEESILYELPKKLKKNL